MSLSQKCSFLSFLSAKWIIFFLDETNQHSRAYLKRMNEENKTFYVCLKLEDLFFCLIYSMLTKKLVNFVKDGGGAGFTNFIKKRWRGKS